MEIAKNKTTATAIALFLLLTVAVALVALPAANAHTPPWTIPTTAYINVAPNPVGVGQQVIVVIWLDRTVAGATAANALRFHNYQLNITKPDKTTEVKTFPYISDPTSSTYTLYTPDQVGTYKFVFYYPGETNTYTASGVYMNDTYAAATSKTFYLTVQQEPLPEPITYPLPTEYWTRPIAEYNTDWWKIASNWLGSGCPKYSGQTRKFQPDGTAPNSAHIMWTKPVEPGGVVGGTNVGPPGETFYSGLSYNIRFGNPIIMYGKLYYELPYGNSASGGGTVCVDLLTGEQLWWTNTTGIGTLSFGYLYDYEDPNQHGVLPIGLLFTSNFARAYDPRTGVVTTTNITNVPSGTAVLGPLGEHLRYALTNIGNATSPNWRLTQWNSSKINQLTPGQIGVSNWFPSSYNASLARMYDWNISIPVLPGLANPTIIRANYGDMIFGTSTTFRGSISPSTWGTPDPYTFWAISLKPTSLGQVLWIKNYSAPTGNVTLVQGLVDFDSRVFTMYCIETLQWYGYSLNDGTQLWGPSERALSDFDYYEPDTTAVYAYGKLFHSTYGGIAFAIDMKTGKRVWTYGNGGSGNSTFAGLQNPWGNYPHQITGVADGKLFLTSTEHSPNSPLYKGAHVICLNATTGEEIWKLTSYGESYGGIGACCAIADGYYVYFNCYDHQVYCIGKGPSATTVEAPMTAITAGDNVVIQGTVTDISAGTKQHVQTKRFPNGVPAVSDASMEGWMEYVYQQQPRPTNTTGVDVTIDALDPNGNFIHIGTATSDTSGLFSYAWTTPDVPGKYTVIATFAGTESYWSSYAETAMVVQEAPPTAPPPQYPVPIDYTLPIVGTGIAIIIAVAIVGILMLRKRP